MADLADKKIAIVADWLTSRGGAERVVLSLAKIFPTADIFTTVFKPKNFPELQDRRVITSYLQNWPLAFKHQIYLWARPLAVESINLDDYDIVISSASAEAKGIITKPETLHICYCHTPTRYFWSHYQEYLKRKEFGLLDPIIKWIVPAVIHKLRIWDRLAADRVDFFIANSKTVQQRIKKYYHADSTVMYPPVDTARFAHSEEVGDYYLVLGRQIAYKRTDLVVECFNKLDRPLKIIGDGPELTRLQATAASKKIQFFGRISDEQVTHLLLGCKALIFPQEEDFGIVPLEAMAAGKGVIAYGVGGGGESVIDGKTGVLFDQQTVSSLRHAIERYETMNIDPAICRARAAEFSEERFAKEILEYVSSKWEEHRIQSTSTLVN